MPKLDSSLKFVVSRRKSTYYLLHTTYFKVKPAFTLIELLVVIAIIGLLASIALASFSAAQRKARDSDRKSDLVNLKKALELQKQDTSGSFYYPTATSTLAPTYIKVVPKDPSTKVDYNYVVPTGCNNTSVYCKDYRLIAILESSGEPQVAESQANCPATGFTGLTYDASTWYVECP